MQRGEGERMEGEGGESIRKGRKEEVRERGREIRIEVGNQGRREMREGKVGGREVMR